MDLKTVKKSADVALTGVTTELEVVDGHVARVKITDANGRSVFIRHTGYSLEVMVPAPPKMVERFQVKGSIKGIDFCERFETEFAARQRIDEIGPDNEVTPEKIEIQEEV
jgi:hypothetical protein